MGKIQSGEERKERREWNERKKKLVKSKKICGLKEETSKTKKEALTGTERKLDDVKKPILYVVYFITQVKKEAFKNRNCTLCSIRIGKSVNLFISARGLILMYIRTHINTHTHPASKI